MKNLTVLVDCVSTIIRRGRRVKPPKFTGGRELKSEREREEAGRSINAVDFSLLLNVVLSAQRLHRRPRCLSAPLTREFHRAEKPVGMYKNQLQELAQHSCFNLPSYSCIREGPDHAPRFKASVNFNGETFESPAFYSTLRQAEHAAAEVALSMLAKRGPSKSIAARVLDETGVYKNLLQETAHRAGLNLPVYATTRSGTGHVPLFSCTVELAGMTFTGEPAKTKKQAQKNAAMVAWSTLKQMSECGTSSSPGCHEEQEQVIVGRFLSTLLPCDSTLSQQRSNRMMHQGSSPTCTGPQKVPSIPNTVYEQHQSWASSGLPPEMAMYYMWLQQQMIGQPSHPQALLVPPHHPRSQFYPLMSSMLQPSYHAYSTPGGCSTFYSLNQFGPAAIRPRSMLTIQEEGLGKLEDSSKPSVSGSRTTTTEMSRQLHGENKREVCLVETRDGYSSPMENPSVQSEQSSSMGLSPNMLSNSSWLQNPMEIGTPHSDPGSRHHPTSNYLGRPRYVPPLAQFQPKRQTFTPPRMSPAVPLMRPRVRKMQTGGLPLRSMAPTVQIRSSVPVFSAPPPRQMTSPDQEGVRPTSSEVNNREQDMSVLNSKLGNLQL